MYLGDRLEMEVTGPSALTGKVAQLIGGLEVRAIGGRIINFTNRDFYIPFDSNDWLLNLMLSGMSSNFIDQGDGTAKASIGIDIPNDPNLRGTYYVMGLAVDQTNFSLLGITGEPVRFQVRQDTRREETILRELQNELEILRANQDILAKRIQRFKKRLNTSLSGRDKLAIKIKANKTQLKITKNKITELSIEIGELEQIINQA